MLTSIAKEEKYENKKWNHELENVSAESIENVSHVIRMKHITFMCGMRKARVSNFQVKTFKKENERFTLGENETK